MNTDSLAHCSSYFSSIMLGSIWNRSSKNYKIPKKKETEMWFNKKKNPRFLPKIENSEISESFIYLNFW